MPSAHGSQGRFLGQELVELGFGGLVRQAVEAPIVPLCRPEGEPRVSCAGDGMRVQVLLELLLLLFEREQLLKLNISLHARSRCRMALLLDFFSNR